MVVSAIVSRAQCQQADDAVAYADRIGRPPTRHGHPGGGQLSAGGYVGHRRGPRTRCRAVVGAYTEQSAILGGNSDRRVDATIISCGEHVPGVVEVGLAKAADAPTDASRRGEALEYRAHDRADKDDVRAGLDQTRHPAGCHPAAADDHHSSSRQPQPDEVRRDAGCARRRSAHGHRVPGVAAARS